jgi:Transglycosylase
MRKAHRWPLIALTGAGALAWGTAVAQLLLRPLAPALQSALATALGLDRDAVHVGGAHIGWLGKLVVTDLRLRDDSAGRIEVTLDPWAALRGRIRPSSLRVRDGGCTLGHIDDLEVVVGDGRGDARISFRGVTVFPTAHWLGGLGAHIGDAGLELEGGAVKRFAFAAGSVGGVDGLVGAAVHAADGAWLVRAARPGMTATARLGSEGADGVARLERMPLAGVPAPRGVELGAATAAGTLVFATDRQGARATLELALDGLAFDHPGLSHSRIDGLAASLTGVLARDRDGLSARDLHIGIGHAMVLVDGRLDGDGQLSGSATLSRLACSDLLASFPRPLVPHLAGLILDGDIDGRLTLALDVHDGSTLAVKLDGNNGCRARSDAALADVGSLVRADAPTLVEHLADGKLFPLSARNPAWRPIGGLPPQLVRAFVVSEDGRFFSHHGFDIDGMGKAVGADLDAGRFERGASTITQQLAKNLWLDGERTLSRKLEEAVLTWRLEQVLDKRRILEIYMNLVELGPGIFGVGDAAEKYFGKLPEELSMDEAAQLAALPPAPRRGMDAAWSRRYKALAARLPSERPLQLPPPYLQLSKR